MGGRGEKMRRKGKVNVRGEGNEGCGGGRGGKYHNEEKGEGMEEESR